MSSISSVSSGVGLYPPSGTSPANTFKNDINALQNALQSGNLSASQSAFSTLQQDLQSLGPAGASSSTSSSTASTLQKDLQAVGSALKSGDVKGAATAFTQLKTDLQSVKGHHGGHHHGGGGGAAAALDLTTTSTDSTDSSSSSTSSSGNSSTATALTDTLLNAIQSATGTTVNQLA